MKQSYLLSCKITNRIVNKESFKWRAWGFMWDHAKNREIFLLLESLTVLLHTTHDSAMVTTKPPEGSWALRP